MVEKKKGEKKMKKQNFIKIIAVVMMSLIMVAFVGCEPAPKPKTFSNAGMSITLTSEYTEKEMVQFTSCYMTSSVVVSALKEEFSLLPGFSNYTLRQYASMIISNNGLSGVTSKTSESGKYVYFKFEKTVSGKDYSYFVTCFKSDDAFWAIQFYCESKNYDKYINSFVGFADSVTFETQTA